MPVQAAVEGSLARAIWIKWPAPSISVEHGQQDGTARAGKGSADAFRWWRSGALPMIVKTRL